MSFLAPFFLLGALVVSVPFVFHLIRRSPRGRVPFSSLMFLRPSPPRITRRSRLDNILLLLLRAAVVCLLAFAFARPFLREAATLGLDAPGRRVALLVDVSASMRREGVWEAAMERCRDTIEDLRDVDVASLHVFDESLRTLVTFEDSARLPAGERREFVIERLGRIEPTWRATDFGAALVAAADAMIGESTADDSDASERALGGGEIILVSDLQDGSDLAALETYEWPEDVHVTIERVDAERAGNAGITVLFERHAEVTPDTLRVRVSNDENTASEHFELRWGGASGEETAGAADPAAITAFVPEGESRVLRVKRSEDARHDRLVLSGDDVEFDNTFFVVPLVKETVEVVYAGPESASDARELRYFLERALEGGSLREVRLTTVDPATPKTLASAVENDPDLVVVTSTIDESMSTSLRSYAASGGTVIAVLKHAADAPGLGALLEVDALTAEEAARADYAMLAEIDFAHPVFAVFADPRFNDFTKIRFWRHRRLALPSDAPEVRVLARFDDDSPAILEKRVDSGRVVVFSSGWQPRDSQLALSSKFVPLVSSLLRPVRDGARAHEPLRVGEAIELPRVRESDPSRAGPSRPDPSSPAPATGAGRAMLRPDGALAALAAEAREFEATELPGIYELSDGGTTRAFAVNLASAESRTSALAIEELENRGVRLERSGDESERERQMRDIELERSQKLWQWLVAAALAVLIAETWLAGRMAREAG